MTYLDKYYTRDAMYGDDIRDIRINSTKRKISSALKDSPSYYQVNLERPLSPAELIDVQIVDDSQVKDEKILTTLYETPISSGNIIMWKSQRWIVIHFDEMSEIYKRVRIRKCLSSLKWLNSDGFVRVADFTLSAPTGTNFGLQDGRIIDMGNERRQLMIQSNSDTKLIHKNQRFIFDGRAWKVTAIDKLTDGIISLTVDEGEIDSAKDNVADRIADYVGNVANFTIQILNGEHFSIRAGTTLQLNVDVKNNGTIVNKAVVFELSDSSIASISSTGLLSATANGTLTVTAKIADYPTIQDIATVSVELDNTNNFAVSIAETPSIINGQSKTFNAIVTNNSIPDSNRFVQWYLYADDGVSNTTLATMTFNSTTQCTLKANSLGRVKLKVVLIGDASVYSIIPIQIKSLI